MPAARAGTRNRITAALAAAAVQALLGFILLHGLTVTMPTRMADTLALFHVAPPPPPPPPVKPPRSTTRKRAGVAAPPNRKATPTEIVAPPPIVPLTVPPPVVAAPVRGTGSDASAGAALLPGPGTGAGGVGNGRGSGGSGDGPGDGGTPLRLISGRLKNSDYPRGPLMAGIGGTVYLRFTVGVTGRVTGCAVTKSSGNIELDETTCRLIQERFRYRPSRDAGGHPVPDVVTGEHVWEVRRDEEPAEPPR